LPAIESYDRFLQQTGWPISSAQALLGSVGLAITLLFLAALFGMSWTVCLLVSLGAVILVQAVLIWRLKHRAIQLETQLPDALALMARSMQAGHAFTSALQIAGQESPDPMGKELRGVFSEIQYGESSNEALAHWAERVAGQDIRIFVIAVRIQSETGGNLAELLQQTAALIRERQKLRGVVRVLSAEGRISALILTLLPFGLAGMLSVLNHGFMSQLWTDPLGIRMLAIALLLMGVGVLWMWRLARLQT
jgi:tight adherence protein B